MQAEDGIRDYKVTGVQTCALPISRFARHCVSTPYGFLTILSLALTLLTGAKINFGQDGSSICSGLVARSEERRVGKEGRSRGEGRGESTRGQTDRESMGVWLNTAP